MSTKRDTAGGRRSSSSATRSAVGSVADDEAVENAVTIATRDPEKKARGVIPPRNQTDAE